MMNGSHMHWDCFKCSSCGTAEKASGGAASSMKLLRGKVEQVKEGTYKCANCLSGSPAEPPKPAGDVKVTRSLPFGTYYGKGDGPDGGEIMYSVRLIEEGDQCWLDRTTKTAIDSGSWHAEGKYVEERSGDKVTCVKFTVAGTPFGGGPEKGKVYEFAVEKGDTNEVLVVEGVKCPLQAGVPDIEIEEMMKATPAVPEAKAVPKAEVTEASQPLPGEGQATKVMAGGHGVMERTQVDTVSHSVVKTPAEAAPAAPAAAAGPTSADFLSLEELKDTAVWKPKGVDAGRREEYLADDEFRKTFGTTKAEFAKLAKWKRDKEKKAHGLY